jgi:hypothetical protein
MHINAETMKLYKDVADEILNMYPNYLRDDGKQCMQDDMDIILQLEGQEQIEALEVFKWRLCITASELVLPEEALKTYSRIHSQLQLIDEKLR